MPDDLSPHGRNVALPLMVVVLILAAMVGVLRGEGRWWWCACGQEFLWSGDIWSSHNSQHLVDPYSFTHVLHGMVFCGLLAWLCPRWPLAWRFVLAIAMESLWEVLENSVWIIQRYRTATMALDYQGDTVANSLGDVLCCVVGFALARRLGLAWSLGLMAVTEIGLILWIRDSLLLNVLMLLCPVDTIRNWQLGG